MSTKFFPMNLAKFKKVAADKHTTTLRHDDGHEIKVAHSALSPKLRGHLAELEHHEDFGKPKLDKNDRKMLMKDGGPVNDTEEYDPYADPVLSRKKQQPEPSPTPSPELQMADGGKVQDKIPEPNKKNAAQFSKGVNSSGWQPDTWVKNIKSAVGMADGGEVEFGDLPSQFNDQFFEEEAKSVTDPKLAEIMRKGSLSEQPQAEALDPSIARKRELYNTLAPDPFKIDANGNAQRLDPAYWGRASELFDQEQQKGPQQDAQAAESIAAENQARQDAKLPLLPVPQGAAPAAPAPMAAASAPQAPMAQAAPQEAAAPQPTVQAPQQESPAAMAERGINAEAAALGKEAISKAKILQDRIQQQQVAEQEFRNNSARLEKERNNFIQDVRDQHIDPSRYMSSLSVTGKIQTVIGLILGGMGQGLAGGDNPALTFLNHQIDRDINAQAAEMGKKENLLKANLQHFGNIKDAMAMTRIMQNDIVSMKLEEAAAKAADPVAKARALQAVAAIREKSAKEQMGLTTQMTIQSAINRAKQDPSKAQDIVDLIQTVDPKRAEHLQKTLVPGVGFANTEKDASDVKESKAGLDNAKQGIKRLLEINKVPGKSLTPSLRAEASTLQQTLVGLLRLPITGPGAMNEGERKMLEGIIANPTNLFSLDSSNKIRLKTLEKKLEGGYNNLLRSKGLAPADPVASLDPQKKEWVKWARNNPNDPKSKLFLKKLGIE